MDLPQKKKEQLLSLQIGNGLAVLLNCAASILGNPVLTHDMDYKLLAHTQNVVSDDPIWNEFISTGTVSSERINFYKDEYFLEQAANASKVTFLYSEKLRYNRIFGKLFNKDNIQVGCACITESQNPFGQDAATLFECLCDVLNREIAADSFFTVYGQEYQEKLINQLINREINDKGIYTAHVESLYINMEEIFYIAVVDFNDSVNLAAHRDFLKSVYPNIKYSIYSPYLVMLISSPCPCTEFQQFDTLLLSHTPFRVGISKDFYNLFDLSTYYNQALSALRLGSNSNQNIFLF